VRRPRLDETHHVSTAFVCGDRTGTIHEQELDRGQGFHNDYEKSKFVAERRVRQAGHLQATVYRPSVIVGDSRTGYTASYQGFYRFLDLALRLAEPTRTIPPRRWLPLRLPFTGAEPRNLVPVDWVSQAIVQIVNRPHLHGRTYHLASPQPVRGQAIKEIAEELLHIDGAQWVGQKAIAAPTLVEELFLERVADFWPYLDGDPVFDCRNTSAALPWLPAPRIDRNLLARLLRFAVADEWGRARRRRGPDRSAVDCAHFIEEFFPESARRSVLARISLDVTVALEVRGPGGGDWSCSWNAGQLLEVRRGLDAAADVTYRMDVSTFDEIVHGRQSLHQLFFAQQIEIDGDVERALKLAVMFDQFLKEIPYRPDACREATHAAA
jgi:nucleoside-diphosphate-sugar epimerase